jgi:hypothetical protein
MENNDIEIKKVETKEVAISTKRTFYMCAYWNTHGILTFNTPSSEKRHAEEYALNMRKYAEHTAIYSFEIDIPNFKNR